MWLSTSVTTQRADNRFITKDGPGSHQLQIRPGIVSDCGTIKRRHGMVFPYKDGANTITTQVVGSSEGPVSMQVVVHHIDFDTAMGVVAYEGDVGFTGDQFFLDGDGT